MGRDGMGVRLQRVVEPGCSQHPQVASGGGVVGQEQIGPPGPWWVLPWVSPWCLSVPGWSGRVVARAGELL